MTELRLRGGHVLCRECGTPLRATRAVGLRGMWPMHLCCAIDRQDEEGAGAHAVAAALNHMRWEMDA